MEFEEIQKILKDTEYDAGVRLHLGCGRNYMPGWVNVDIGDVKKDFYFDLEKCPEKPSVFGDNTFTHMYCAHTLEHIKNILPLMEELYRIAKDGCVFIITVPHGSNDAAFEDPTHVRHFFEKSFLYFGQSMYGGADYGYKGDWENTDLFYTLKQSTLKEFSSYEQCQAAIHSWRNVVEDFHAVLIARKPARTNLKRFDTPAISILSIKDE